MKWARIENNLVMETTDIDPEGRFHESLIWVECPEDVVSGWTYSGSQFNPPPDTTELDNLMLQSNLMAEANHHISVLTDATDPDIMGDDIDPNDVALLKAWKLYRVQLSKVTDMLNPVWPTKPNA